MVGVVVSGVPVVDCGVVIVVVVAGVLVLVGLVVVSAHRVECVSYSNK